MNAKPRILAKLLILCVPTSVGTIAFAALVNELQVKRVMRQPAQNP